MEMLYYIKNKKTYCFLNKKGGWNRGRATYGVVTFNSKEEAEAAIPAGTECYIENSTKKEKPVLENVEYVLYFKGKILSNNQTFSLLDKKDKDVLKFASEDDAVSKADSLDLDMDFVEVDTVKKS